jgi:hypothetical protein
MCYQISVFQTKPFEWVVQATKGKYRVIVPVWMPNDKCVAEAKHINKAQRTDGKGEVEGWYDHWYDDICSIEYHYVGCRKIKPETLRIIIGDRELTKEEVEERFKPKSCENCRYFKDGDSLQWCVNEELNRQIDPDGKIDDWFTPTYDFCCNKYEPKDKS